MGEPELNSDETVVIRTQGIFVKSIPFEGLLTSRRIILTDRAKNLLPQKEIPLATIRDVQAGENAIRDPTLALSVVSRSGELRQMILTFSRQTGGTRIRERDAWMRALKELTSSPVGKIIQKVMPAREPSALKSGRPAKPRIEILSAGAEDIPAPAEPPSKIGTGPSVPVDPVNPAIPPIRRKGTDFPAAGITAYCTRCGHRVPDGSAFCNRCGSPIVQSQGIQVSAADGLRQEVRPPLQSSANPPDSGVSLLGPPFGQIPEEPVKRPAGGYQGAPAARQEMAGAPGPASSPPVPEDGSRKEAPAAHEPRRPKKDLPDGTPQPSRVLRGFGIRPPRRIWYLLGALVLVIALVVGGGLYLGSIREKGGSTAAPATATPTPLSTTSAGAGSTVRVTPAVTVPPEGIYIHIRYLGSWKGTYGSPDDLKRITNSGDRYYPVENATGTVEASFEKLDGSVRQTLTVEILRDGRVLTSGNTTAGFGMIVLSVDTATGIAKKPLITSRTAAQTPTPVSSAPTTTIKAATTTPAT